MPTPLLGVSSAGGGIRQGGEGQRNQARLGLNIQRAKIASTDGSNMYNITDAATSKKGG